MALFTGAGDLAISGTSARVHDIEMGGSGVLNVGGQRVQVRNVVGQVNLTGNFNSISDSQLAEVTVTASYCRMTNCDFVATSDGLVITGDQNIVSASLFYSNGTADTDLYDSVRIDGSRNRVQGNTFVPAVGSTRSAVHLVGGECNQVWGNDLGDSDDYTTDAIIDAAGNTQLFFPAGAYGDNLADCGSGS